MKRSWLIGAGLAVFVGAGVAVAQAPSPPPEGGPLGETRGGEMRGGEMRGGEMRHGEMGMHGHGMMHRPPPSKAARFMFRKGDAVVAIKCADDEPMKACVDAGSALLDKLVPPQK